MAPKVKKVSLDKPSLEEVSQTINADLGKYFKHASSSVVECPDLTQAPFHLAGSGLNGKPKIADIGGPPYLIPLVQRDKVYSFEQVTEAVHDGQNALLLGATCGPFEVVGQNCELMVNALLEKKNGKFVPVFNNTHYSKVTCTIFFQVTYSRFSG